MIRTPILRVLSIMLVASAVLGLLAASAAAGDSAPLVIGHRGAPGYPPDHTLEGYSLAIALGANYIEPDLVATKDGHLIARHEPNLKDTTDVKDRPEFASRFRTAVIDGFPEDGWFASDFTLAEIKKLRAVQPLAERPQQFNGRFEIPTFDEVIALAKHKSREMGRTIGIYPETTLEFKAPFDRPFDWTASGDPRLLARTFAFFATDEGLREVRTYADGIGPWKRYIVSAKAIKLNPDGTTADNNGDGLVNETDLALLPPTDLIRRAHAKGLLVHTWTFRNEQRRLVSDLRAIRSASTSSSIGSASMGCSRTSPTPPSRRGSCPGS